MKRRLFTIISAVSLLLCLATISLWVWSYWTASAIGYSRFDDNQPLWNTQHGWFVQNVLGEMDFGTSTYSEPRDFNLHTIGWQYQTLQAHPNVTLRGLENALRKPASGWFLGFGFLFSDGRPLGIRAICLPHWFLASLFAILPTLYLRSCIRSRGRLRVGLCPVCGYDLRATPERCPECGRVVGSMQ